MRSESGSDTSTWSVFWFGKKVSVVFLGCQAAVLIGW